MLKTLLSACLIWAVCFSAVAQKVLIETSLGTIAVKLQGKKAPKTVANFLRYVDAGRYDGGSFYRAVRQDNSVPNKPFIEVIQGGVNKDTTGSFPPIAIERTSETGLKHLDGTISMARGTPDSATSEFFICINDQPQLDFGGKRNPDGQGFAAFGRVTKGMDIVRQIQQQQTGMWDVLKLPQRILEPVKILRIRRK